MVEPAQSGCQGPVRSVRDVHPVDRIPLLPRCRQPGPPRRSPAGRLRAVPGAPGAGVAAHHRGAVGDRGARTYPSADPDECPHPSPADPDSDARHRGHAPSHCYGHHHRDASGGRFGDSGSHGHSEAGGNRQPDVDSDRGQLDGEPGPGRDRHGSTGDGNGHDRPHIHPDRVAQPFAVAHGQANALAWINLGCAGS